MILLCLECFDLIFSLKVYGMYAWFSNFFQKQCDKNNEDIIQWYNV
jgi:hypothetical protein